MSIRRVEKGALVIVVGLVVILGVFAENSGNHLQHQTITMKYKRLVLENDTGNLLEALNLSEDQYGIEKLLCLNQSDGDNYAIRFNNPSESTLATSNLFPNGFPTDFSILIVVRQLTIGKKIKTAKTRTDLLF